MGSAFPTAVFASSIQIQLLSSPVSVLAVKAQVGKYMFEHPSELDCLGMDGQ